MAKAKSTCAVPSCDRERRKVGYCDGHYQRVKKHGDPGVDKPLGQRGKLSGRCTAPGCTRDITNRTRGLCDAHYKRVWRDETADLSKPPAPPRAAPITVRDFPDGTRECQGCGARKPMDDFHRDATSPGGRRKQCKLCRVARETQRYWSDVDAHKARMRDYRRTNIEAVRAREARYYESNRDTRIASATEAAHRRRASVYAARRDAGISKAKLREIDGFQCCYCGVEMVFESFPRGKRPDTQATIEHVIPLSRGGSHTWDNCALACWRCNISKGARDGEWRLREGHRLAAGSLAVGVGCYAGFDC